MASKSNKLQFGSALTTVGPGSSHANFQYKPLGFEKFAAPLQKMQGYYDQAQAAVEDLDFQIKHLPYGTDPAKAKELADQMTVKRDQIVNDLTKSKDYRNASRSIKKMQNNWTKNKHRKSLESNYASWIEKDKEQKERYLKGDIDRDYYYDWRARSIQDFEAKDAEGNLGGTNFKDDGLDGTYNTIGRIGRLNDKTKELRELSLKLADMTHSEKSTWFGERGITDWGDIESVTYTKEGKNAKDVATKIEDFLKTQPDFIDWASEVAENEHWKLTNYSEGDVNYEDKNKNYNKVAGELVKNRLSLVDNELERLDKLAKKDKSILESDSYTRLEDHKENLDKQKSGEYDPKLIKELHHNKSLAKTFNSDTVGELVEYQNITKSRSHSRLPSSGSGNKLGPEYIDPSLFTPIQYNKIDLKGIATRGHEAKVNLTSAEKDVNDMTNGNVRSVVMGNLGGVSGEGKYTIDGVDYNKRGGVWFKQTPQGETSMQYDIVGSQLLDEKAKGSKRAELKHNTIEIGARQLILRDVLTNSSSPEEFQERLNDQGITTDKKIANAIYNDLKDTDQGAVFANNVSKVEKNYYNAKGLSEHLDNLSNSALSTPEFNEITNNTRMDVDYKVAAAARKAGFLVNSTEPSEFGGPGYNTMSTKQYLKFKKYTSAKDGYLKGDPLLRKYFTKDVYRIAADETINKEEMGFRYVGNEEVNKSLKNYFQGAISLSEFAPAYGDNWNNQVGFDDKGKLLGGTQIDNDEGKGVRLVKQGNQSLIEVPIKIVKAGNPTIRSLVYVKPKKGANIQLQELYRQINYISSGNSPKDKQTNAIVKVMMFNSEYEHQYISQKGMDAVNPYSENGYDIKIPGKVALSDNYRGINFGSFQYDPSQPNRYTFVKVKVPHKEAFVLIKDSNGNYIMDKETEKPAEYPNPDAAKAAFMVGR